MPCSYRIREVLLVGDGWCRLPAQIEELRLELEKHLSQSEWQISDEVVALSRELDKLLADYMKQLKTER